jgi:hypothetical protein
MSDRILARVVNLVDMTTRDKRAIEAVIAAWVRVQENKKKPRM